MVALKAEFQRELIIYRRYLFSSVSDLALTILMFMGIFWVVTQLVRVLSDNHFQL